MRGTVALSYLPLLDEKIIEAVTKMKEQQPL